MKNPILISDDILKRLECYLKQTFTTEVRHRRVHIIKRLTDGNQSPGRPTLGSTRRRR